jgi:MtrB/PioB family decaheme-associated outer membrane protein
MVMKDTRESGHEGDATMNSYNTYLKILLLTGGCLFTAGLYAAEESMEEDVMPEAVVTEEGMAEEEGMDEESMAADEGMEEEGMLEEEGEELPPLYTSEIELGVGYSTTNTFSAGTYKFGEYNGLQDDGPFAISNILLRKYSVIGDEDNNYWEFRGTNLGLEPRNVYMEYSHDGTYGEYSSNSAYRAFIEYDQIPHFQFEDGQTPFKGAGTTHQTLPAGWVGADNTGGLTALDASLHNVKLETERYRIGGGLRWDFTDHWLAKVNYRHEIKDGSDPIGAIFGSSGGNPRGSIIAVPINYDTDEFDANLAYVGDKGQASLNYHLSLFNNNDNSVFFDNPFNNWGAPANFSDGAVGQLSLFPDNQAHQVQFAGGYNFSPKTRATTTISYSRWLQNDDFLPFSNVFPAAVLPLPRNSLEGDIETLFANVNLYSRLTNKLDAKTRFTFEDRDNNTDRDIFLRIPGDSAPQDPAGVDSDQARVNWTYDLRRYLVEPEVGYRITPMTKLLLGYAYERKERNMSEVDTTNEHSGKIKLSATPFDTATGWIKYTYSTLDGSDYISNNPLLHGHSNAHIDDVITADCGGDPTDVNCAFLYENDPLIRKFYFANRDRNRVQSAINFYPTEKVDFTVNGEYRNDDYHDSQLGLQNSRHYAVTLDMGFHPTDLINMYAFVTHQNFEYDQRGYRRTGSPPIGPLFPHDPATDPAGWGFWTTDTTDQINMVGAGFDWLVMQDKLKLNLDFTFSKSITSFDQKSGVGLTGGNVAEQLPDVTTRLYNLSLAGEYKIKDNMKARLQYIYERYSTKDFGLDRVDPDTLSNVILMGQQSPNYGAHVLGLTFVYEFQ